MASNIKLTKQQKQYLAAGIVFLGGFGYVYMSFFWLPFSQKIKEFEEKIAATDKEIEMARAQAARLPRIEAELALLNQQAAEAEKRLPRVKSVPDILVTLTTLAKKYNVDILSFSPGAQSSREFFFELSYPVAVRGSYHNLGRFLAAVALEERIFNVQSINFGGASAEKGTLSVSFTLLSYQYKG